MSEAVAEPRKGEPTGEQLAASTPGGSVWVSASAGSGKTKVLTDRVLRLLLSGASVHRILCLTYTKAAAGEMVNRLTDRLAHWATCAPHELSLELTALTGSPIADSPIAGKTVEDARRLFAEVLDNRESLRIETIHAFCQSLLRRFPLEAGVAPHFGVIEEREAADLLTAARMHVLTVAQDADDGVAEALSLLAGQISADEIDNLLRGMVAARGKLSTWIDAHGGLRGALAALPGVLGLPGPVTPEAVIAAACAEGAFDREGLRGAAVALLGGSGADGARGQAIAGWLAGDEAARRAGFGAYRRVWLTQKGTPQKTLATKKVSEADPDAADALAREQARIVDFVDELLSAGVLAGTTALVRVADAVIARYQAMKTYRAALDYEDLIARTLALLRQPGIAPWVHYKIDGGLAHILIDEAQDTSPDQWEVMRLLADEFFAHAADAAGPPPRTVFAVGDEKQSIYSFQGADPALFGAMRTHFETEICDAGYSFSDIALGTSFRSVRAVLDTVDAVFKRPAAADGVQQRDRDWLEHKAHREGAGGFVELWGLEPRAVDDTPPPWKPPVEATEERSPVSRLATRLADRIAAMIGNEVLESKGRAIRAGDILVLVRRRFALDDMLVRELKARGVPVAGRDRLKLTDHIAVQDLIAFARVIVLPDDDLTLAAALKSPLLGCDEDDLFALAAGRQSRRLWKALQEKAETDPDSRLGRAHATIEDFRRMAARLSPHALVEAMLNARDGNGGGDGGGDDVSGRERMLRRLGPDAADPIDELLSLALAYEARHAPSLIGFVQWLASSDVEVKRDPEQGSADVVRVMTVHGAKGLQAPVVFLPDTTGRPKVSNRVFWQPDPAVRGAASGAAAPLWAPRRDDEDATIGQAHQLAEAAQRREYHRLLYVAMTRAEDRLYVCGVEPASNAGAVEESWHGLVRAGLEDLSAAEVPDGVTGGAGLEDLAAWRYACPQKETPRDTGAPDAEVTGSPLPFWARNDPARERPRPVVASPSGGFEEAPPVLSPRPDTAAGDLTPRQRGNLIHAMLQALPEVPPDRRDAAARRLVARRWPGAPEAEAGALAQEALAVIGAPDLARLFGPGSLAEVPIVGVHQGAEISGQVDRMSVLDDRVVIADFKTNRAPPATVATTPPAYLRQMALYRSVLRRVFPDRPVECWLIWTAGPRADRLADAELDRADLA